VPPLVRFAVLAGVDLGEEQGDRKTTKRLSLASGLNNTTTVMGTVNFISFLPWLAGCLVDPRGYVVVGLFVTLVRARGNSFWVTQKYRRLHHDTLEDLFLCFGRCSPGV